MTNHQAPIPKRRGMPFGDEVIDLSSPERPDSTQAPTTMDNKPSRLQQSSWDSGHMRQAGLAAARPGNKRLWGEMTSERDDSVVQMCDMMAAPLQWGSTGPRMARAQAPTLQQHHQQQQLLQQAQPQQLQLRQQQQQQEQQQQQQQQQQPPPNVQHSAAHAALQPTLPTYRRKLTVRPRGSRQQQQHQHQAEPVVVIDDGMSPAARKTVSSQQEQQQGSSFGIATAATAAAAGAAGAATNNYSSRAGPTSIRVNRSISSHRTSAAAATGAAGCQSQGGRTSAPLLLRRVIPPPPVAAAAAAAAAAAGGQQSAGMSRAVSDTKPSGSGDTSSDAELARKAQQEEEDAALARRLMQEEQQLLLAQQEAAARHRLFLAQEEAEEAAATATAAATAAAAAASSGTRGRRGARRPQQLPPDLLLLHQQQQQQQWGPAAAMAQAFMSMPRWGLPGGPGGVSGRSLPPTLTAVREAVLGMQRAGLPPQLLFSDRDFTADDYELLCRLDDTVENRKGAAATTIASLPTQTVPAGGLLGAAGERLSCAVCLEEFAEGAELRALPCLHRFHRQCIDQWLVRRGTCPICNRECR